jgi:DNA-directed RNA polymerase subunit N (RpoN/RPB10)
MANTPNPFGFTNPSLGGFNYGQPAVLPNPGGFLAGVSYAQPQINTPAVQFQPQIQVPAVGLGSLGGEPSAPIQIPQGGPSPPPDQELAVSPPQELVEPVRETVAVEQSQRPAAYVSRAQPTQVRPVPPEVMAFRQLSREEQVLRAGNPREIALMAPVCYSCGKPILQVDIEDELKKGTPLRQILDQQHYIRMCCRKQIQEEPVVVNLLKQRQQQQATAARMRNLSLENTGAALVNRTSLPVGPGLLGGNARIVTEVPPGIAQETIQLDLRGTVPKGQEVCLTGLNESFVEERVPTGDVFEYFMSRLEDRGDDDED